MSMSSRRLSLRIVITVVAGIVLAGAILALTILYQDQSIISQPATCLSDHCFCEEPAADGLVQPINAITSLVFVVLGLWVLVSKFKKDTKEQTLVKVFGVTLVFIGISSFFYHGTLSFLGQFLDVFSMYIFGTLLILGALIRRNQLSFRNAIILFVISNIVLGILQFYYPEARRILFALILLPGIVLEFLPRTTGLKATDKKMRFLYVGLGSIILGYAVWLLDQNSIVCWPDSILQGHGIWHILTAVAAYMIVLHYKQTSHRT